jgi:GNAT superfamily N-acetyltransferase
MLSAKDFETNGRMIGELGLPVLVIQEGGYRTRTLGINARHFFHGLAATGLQVTSAGHYRKERLHGIKLRYEIQAQDAERIGRLVQITGFFNPAEVAVAVELVNERLARGNDSGYYFVLAEQYGRLAGYSCYGPVPATASSYDLYWIVVQPDLHRRGLGLMLLKVTEKRIKKAGGARIYVDTSMRAQYASTRAFYESCGYRLESVLDDFYAPGEAKAVYCKRV